MTASVSNKSPVVEQPKSAAKPKIRMIYKGKEITSYGVATNEEVSRMHECYKKALREELEKRKS